MRIDYVDARAGAGKTYGAAGWIAEAIERGDKVLLVQPITRLVAETIADTFPAMDVPAEHVTEITSRNSPTGVLARIVAHMNEAVAGRGEVLVITHAAFVLLSGAYTHRRSDWTVIVDEVLDVQGQFAYNLPNTHSLLTEHLEIIDDADPTYWRVGKRSGSTHLEAIARNPMRDEIYGKLQGFAACVLSDDWRVYVRADSYTTLVNNLDVPGINRKLTASAILQPSIFHGFRRVIIMSACFTQTVLYMVWSRAKVDPVEFRDVTSMFRLRYDEHPNGETITFLYQIDRHFSKRLRGRQVEMSDGEITTVFDALTKTARQVFGAERVAVLTNNDFPNPETLFETGTVLPAFAHGLNTFQHIDNAVLLIAANPTPQHLSFLTRFADLDPEEIKTAMHRQVVYQAAARISVRDPSNTDPKTIYVPDRDTAVWLSGLFPGSSVEKIEGEFSRATALDIARGGRPRKDAPKSNAERQAEWKEKKAHEGETRMTRELRLRLVNDHAIADRHVRSAGDLATAMSEMPNVRVGPVARDTFQGSVFDDVTTNVGDAFAGSFDDLVALFRETSGWTFPSKDRVGMWSPALFVADSPNFAEWEEHTKAGYQNIAWTRHIMLDNDGGDLSPGQFAALLPGVRMVVYSTWSSSRTMPKWRALIPTDHVMDIDGYKQVTSALMAHLESAGYHGEKTRTADPESFRRRGLRLHGFDPSKLKATDRFFLPCLGEHPEASFFTEHAGGRRAALDVYEWAARAPIPPAQRPVETGEPLAVPPPNPNASPALRALQARVLEGRTAGQDRRKGMIIQVALNEWQANGDREGQRDAGYWRLGCSLRHAGCDEAEWKREMRGATQRKELRGKIGRMWGKVTRR